MKGSIYIEVEGYAGSSVEDVAEDMSMLSGRMGISVWLNFNGIRLLATPTRTPGEITHDYYKTRGKQ